MCCSRFLDQVVRFAGDGSEARAAGREAVRFARDVFAATSVLDALESLLAEVVGRAGAPEGMA